MIEDKTGAMGLCSNQLWPFDVSTATVSVLEMDAFPSFLRFI